MFTCREGMLENCKTVKTVAPFECNDLIGELPKYESVAWSKIKFVWKLTMDIWSWENVALLVDND